MIVSIFSANPLPLAWSTVRFLFRIGPAEQKNSIFNNAFVQSTLSEPIYLELPPGYASTSGSILLTNSQSHFMAMFGRQNYGISISEILCLTSLVYHQLRWLLSILQKRYCFHLLRSSWDHRITIICNYHLLHRRTLICGTRLRSQRRLCRVFWSRSQALWWWIATSLANRTHWATGD